MAAVWKQLRQLRHRDMLQSSLLRAFERDQLECRVLQSDAFRPLLTRWADSLLERGASTLDADPHAVPDEVLSEAKKSRNPEVRWLVRRLASGDKMRRGPPHFPSVLLQKGPQYPFQPHELTYLRGRAGSIRGTELTERIELPEPPAGGNPQPESAQKVDLWAQGCLDDDDLVDFRKAPAGSR
eukprot:gnl/TRDRNA2_/TRDRNA2_186219_c0_seq1.p1 gnl/TRDRNA2_/TRDRNA2_186219_c0~~gnl/TRDRNA2_/TRDRNA2_186219_c0_seq1.p1  ORF type:complete len:183 (+),score=28.60 gnl/TRDRNA2_/TRDRNA2_186219_c0_seq1:84-632(+)